MRICYKIIQIWKYTKVHVEKYRCKKCRRVCKESKYFCENIREYIENRKYKNM